MLENGLNDGFYLIFELQQGRESSADHENQAEKLPET